MFLRQLQVALFACLAGMIGQLCVHASELCVTVNDPEDLPLPHAWVNVTDRIAVKTYNESTDSKGRTCLTLPEGTYAVEAGLTGFLNVRYYPVRVTYPNPLNLTFRLPFGDITEGPLEHFQ